MSDDVVSTSERSLPAARPFDHRPRRRRRGRPWDVLAVIALGGGLGSLARYLVSCALPTRLHAFPWGTLAVNVTGCLALGALMTLLIEIWPPSRYLRPFVSVGFVGGYTTFSTYVMEIERLAGARDWALADSYALTTLLAGLAAVWCGIIVARWASRRPGGRRRGDT